ncbi:thiolase family protein [bacterium]|nr:thiolase family protein [bacterium]
MNKERIAIVDGIRTPMAKSGTDFASIEADDLGAIPVRELLARTNLNPNEIDEVIIGNVAQPAHAANVGRVISLKAGVPKHVHGITVHRNCASGMESISSGMNRIHLGESNIVLAGGVESMSNIPLLYNKSMTAWFYNMFKARTTSKKIKNLLRFRLKMLKPIIGLEVGLTDPVCGMMMGMTAENLAREFHITREEQDQFALLSHQKAAAAIESGRLAEEIVSVPVPPKYKKVMEADNGPRMNQTIEALAKLRPYFDRKNGTVTVGTSSQVTDGAASVLLMKESQAKAMGYTPLGYIKNYAYAGCEPSRMGLGPIYATAKLMEKEAFSMSDVGLVEINEAFAAQVIANVEAFDSDKFAQKYLNRSTKIGAIDPAILNVNGGALSLGHPLGMTGTRLIITILKEMHRRSISTGLASLCIGGGQGAAFLVEAQ